jgi:hypothetical protein
MQPLTADQLAQIVGVTAWTATYSGGPIECWLEIEEQGQATMPKRIPEKDSFGAGSVNPPTEGTILFWWSRRQDGQGGQLMIQAPHGSYGYGLNKDAFTFGWRGSSEQPRVIGKEELKTGEPGKEFVIVDYDANEIVLDPEGGRKVPRRVHLKLMGRFPVKK